MTQSDPTVNSPVEPDRGDRDPAEPDRVGYDPSPDTTVYVRSRRTPTLAFWVVLGLITCMLVASYLVSRFVERPVAKPMKRE